MKSCFLALALPSFILGVHATPTQFIENALTGSPNQQSATDILNSMCNEVLGKDAAIRIPLSTGTDSTAYISELTPKIASITGVLKTATAGLTALETLKFQFDASLISGIETSLTDLACTLEGIPGIGSGASALLSPLNVELSGFLNCIESFKISLAEGLTTKLNSILAY